MIFYNEQHLQRVTSDFLQRATSVMGNERILQRATTNSASSNEQRVNLQRVTSELQWVTSDFTTSKEQRVKSYASPYRLTLAKLYEYRVYNNSLEFSERY